jgi:hypothetical protein
MSRKPKTSKFFDNNTDDFFDDASSFVQYDEQYEDKSILRSKRQTEATLGGFLDIYGESNYRESNYGQDDILYNKSEFGTSRPSTSDGVEKLVANLTYVDPPKPMYDPTNTTEADVTANGGMIIPMMIDFNNQNDNSYHAPSNNYTAPMTNKKPKMPHKISNVQKVDPDREKRINELKNEIGQLDQTLQMDEAKERKQSKRCCCCMPATRKSRIIVFVVTLLIIGIIGIILWIFWPSAPQFRVVSLVNFPGLQPVLVVAQDRSSFRLQYALNLTVEVTNGNKYDIKTDQILMNAYISPNMIELAKNKLPGSTLTGRVDDHLVGTAKVENVRFSGNSNKIFFAKLNVDFIPDPDLGMLNDPAIGEILRVCSPEGKKNKAMMKIIYQVDVKIGIFTRFGFTPKILNEASVTCPLGSFSDDLIKQPMFASYLAPEQAEAGKTSKK